MKGGEPLGGIPEDFVLEEDRFLAVREGAITGRSGSSRIRFSQS